MKYLFAYRGFDIYDNRTPECITKYPITVKLGQHFVGSYRDVLDATDEIDANPDWLRRKRDEIAEIEAGEA